MSCDFLQLAVPGVREMSPYQPGKPIEELAREQGLKVEDIVKLASNENPLGPPPAALKAMAESLAELARYPDGSSYQLKQALAEKLKVAPEQLTLGNGSNDVLVLLAESFLDTSSSAVFSQYAFVVYPLAVKAVGAESIVVPALNYGHDLDAMAEAIQANTRIVFLANPNNPTGTSFSEQDLLGFLGKVPKEVIVVLDEAYFEYGVGGDLPDGIDLLDRYPNLVVTRTFSKAYGLAGARVGYSISNPEIADVLNRLRQPFNLNLPAQFGAVAALKDEAYLQQSIEINQQGMAFLEQGFAGLGLDWIPSSGNFITVDLKRNAMSVYEGLLSKGIIVRPVANYGMPEHLRISIGLPEENRRCLEALSQVLGQSS
ncbi:histidinol-phosphate transaminase [Endozoicomonas sp. GU-1]|uniref:histidinol-phosphate transaminase n=1 Tax=Endozoicomonas sp. GU-1 TaxID=3009078 RepID=UPI0022B54697|nr:histidinol-phosphate transaminase [Endozoicomonas sp. GU-1]WBA83659.1 histidinol-phosphate transaminase [Endozoicomonas sp. GU-1]WBA88752.1 histidinol-phosphate transaminase [Endozoicomonas sp. GU-1]